MITPINAADATKAVVTMFKEDTRLAGVAIERASEINKVPQPNGWLGIYRAFIEYPARTLGRGTGYRKQRIHLVVLAQHSDGQSGEQCEDKLEELVQIALSTILSDESLRGVVDALDEITVRYEGYLKSSSVFMQTALISFVGEVNVTAS